MRCGGEGVETKIEKRSVRVMIFKHQDIKRATIFLAVKMKPAICLWRSAAFLCSAEALWWLAPTVKFDHDVSIQTIVSDPFCSLFCAILGSSEDG
jgi:hypothetical protein